MPKQTLISSRRGIFREDGKVYKSGPGECGRGSDESAELVTRDSDAE